jgi:integrase
MAHLIRPWQVRYVDAEGRRCGRDDPGARKVKERARKWYGAGVPGLPPGKRVPLASDKNVARQLLAEMVRKAERGEAGLADRVTSARTIPLVNHVDGYLRYLRSKARRPAETWVKLVAVRIRTAAEACGFVYPQDLDAQAVLAYLSDRRSLPTDAGGLSVRTSNGYLAALNGFSRWMVHNERLPRNPFAGVEWGNPDLDQRHALRNLEPGELARLLPAVAASGRTFRGLSGGDRHALYLTACGTGFRAQELASLTPESFDLDAGPPVARVAARYSKNRRAVTQPLPSAVAAVLRGFLKGRPAGGRVWPRTWWRKAALMLRRDLADVGIPYVVKSPDGDRYADFHGLRHSYITLLDRAGASPNAAKELARHGDLRLTYDTYGHNNLANLAEAVDRLPLPGAAAAPVPPAAAALAVLAAVYQTLVAPRVALPDAPGGDCVGRDGTEAEGTRPRGTPRKPATAKQFRLVGTG